MAKNSTNKNPSIFSTLQKTAANASAVNSEIVRELSLDTLVANPMNRFSMEDDAEFEATVASIAKNGLLEDIIVTPGETEGTYRIVSGHRRVLAARKLGKTTIPCKVRAYPDKLSELRALMGANLHRRSISPFEMAGQLETLREVLREEGRLPEGIKEQAEFMAEQVQLSRATVERYLDLLHLDETLTDWAKAGKMTMTDAYELARKQNRFLYTAVEIYVQENAKEDADYPALVHRAILFAKENGGTRESREIASEAAAKQTGNHPAEIADSASALRAVDSFDRSLRRSAAKFRVLRFEDGADRAAARKKLDACLENIDALRKTVEALRQELGE